MPDFDFSTLITDRSAADVRRLRELADRITGNTDTAAERAAFETALKGAYGCEDMNRVGEAVTALAEILEGYGYGVSVDPETDVSESDTPSPAQLAAYLSNVRSIRNALGVPPTTPALPEDMTLDTDGANAIEQNLRDVHTLVGNMEKAFPRSGAAISGVPYPFINGPAKIPDYLRFSSDAPFTLKVFDNTKHWDGTLQYRAGLGNWADWDGTIIHSENGTIDLRGIANTVITGALSTGRRFVIAGNNVSCTGNIEMLLDYQSAANGEHPPMGDMCFTYLFSMCNALVTPPATPSPVLTERCYSGMCSYCTSLTKISALPATELTTFSCSRMYANCPAIKLSETKTDAYQYEFRIPTNGVGTDTSDFQTALSSMFADTGGTFSGEPSINTTYYTDHEPVS